MFKFVFAALSLIATGHIFARSVFIHNATPYELTLSVKCIYGPEENQWCSYPSLFAGKTFYLHCTQQLSSAQQYSLYVASFNAFGSQASAELQFAKKKALDDGTPQANRENPGEDLLITISLLAGITPSGDTGMPNFDKDVHPFQYSYESITSQNHPELYKNIVPA